MQAKRLDLGADIVVLPERDLIVFHPDLDYADSLGAVMGTLPDLHPDAAVCLVEQVTPRPKPEPEPAPRPRWPRVLAVLTAIMAMTLFPAFALEPAAAGARFGPDWRAAAKILGLDCPGSGESVRTCAHKDGHRVEVRGYAHEEGDLYAVSSHGCRAIVFVFDDLADAEAYAAEHPAVIRAGRAVIW